jgi:hypothetical protein
MGRNTRKLQNIHHTTRLHNTSRNKTKQDSTRQYKTVQDKIRQDKTRQDKTKQQVTSSCGTNLRDVFSLQHTNKRQTDTLATYLVLFAITLIRGFISMHPIGSVVPSLAFTHKSGRSYQHTHTTHTTKKKKRRRGAHEAGY